MAQTFAGGAVRSNATCDVYRSGNAPPAAPDVAGVAVTLSPAFAGAHAAQTTSSTALRWTHVLLCPLATDIRDAYIGGIAGESVGSTPDTLFVPDKTGTKFTVVFVERVRPVGGGDYLRVYVQRGAPSWPTNQL